MLSMSARLYALHISKIANGSSKSFIRDLSHLIDRLERRFSTCSQ
jgi:hypothetical protein